MALPSSGLIKFSQIQTEFGGTDPIKLSEYYGYGTVPSSGLIKMSDFYGLSSVRYISGAAATANPVSISSSFSSGTNTNTSAAVSSGGGGPRVQFGYGSGVRYGQSQWLISITNLFNISGISSADAGKAIALYYRQLNVFRGTNGSDDTGTVTDSVGSIGVSYAANGTSENFTAGWITAGNISSASNGSCSFFVNHASNQSTSDFSGQNASLMTVQHNLYSSASSQAIRIT